MRPSQPSQSRALSWTSSVVRGWASSWAILSRAVSWRQRKKRMIRRRSMSYWRVSRRLCISIWSRTSWLSSLRLTITFTRPNLQWHQNGTRKLKLRSSYISNSSSLHKRTKTDWKSWTKQWTPPTQSHQDHQPSDQKLRNHMTSRKRPRRLRKVSHWNMFTRTISNIKA